VIEHVLFAVSGMRMLAKLFDEFHRPAIRSSRRSGAGAHFLLVETGQQKRGDQGAFLIGARRKEAGKLFVAVCLHKGRDALGYVYVHESVAKEFLEKLVAAIKRMYGDDPQKRPDFARTISEHDVDRMASYLIPGKDRPRGPLRQSSPLR
jgi:hypothetical protein